MRPLNYHFLLSDRLAQGSAPPTDVRVPFDTIVLSAIEYQPSLQGYDVVHVPLYDDGPPSARERFLIVKAARDVARRVRAGERVLVTCWQGRNRSGVIAGLALVELGISGPSAALKIQRLRDGLRNPHFLDMVVRSRPWTIESASKGHRAHSRARWA